MKSIDNLPLLNRDVELDDLQAPLYLTKKRFTPFFKF
jgi:hypothetical protein